MTLSIDGVRLHASRRSRSATFLILAVEAVLSVFLYVSFAAHLVWPDLSRAAAGVSPYLSYEGRLTDSSGNVLGGTGEPYCFRFSIYDSASGGTKLWPAGTPNVTVATTTDGVFSALVGQADALTYDFYSSDTVYLNVEVNTATSTNGSTCSGSYESLSPRQTIAASGYARSAQNVYSSLLKTNVASNRVDIGTGTGVASPILLELDWNNQNQYVGQTCSTNGTLWYNSAQSMALVCENGIIKNIGNSTTTIAALTDGTNTISNGTVSFDNGNGVSFGINGNTITASAGSPDVTYLSFQNRQLGASTQSAPGQNSLWLAPFRIPGGVQISASTLQFMQSLTGTVSSVTSGTWGETLRWGIYSNNTSNSTQVQSWITGSLTMDVVLNGASLSWHYNGSSSSSTATGIVSQITGLRMHNIVINSSIPGGLYVMGFAQSTSSGGYSAVMRTFGIVMDNPVPVGMGNNFGASTATSIGYADAGTYSVTTGGMPATIALSEIKQRSNVVPYFKMGAI